MDKESFSSLRDSANSLRDIRKGALTEKGMKWPVRDSRIEHFANYFGDVVPETSEDDPLKRFREYIEKTIASENNDGNFTAIEFGGEGSRLFRGFSAGFFKKTVGVCLSIEIRRVISFCKNP